MTAGGAPVAIVAEDNPRDRDYLVARLDGMDCRAASRGDEALELFRGRPDACVVTDLQMPGLNGVELAAAVWAISPDARVIVWSQYDDEVYLRALERVLPADALFGYVLKNVASKVLRRAIESVFVDGQCWIDPQVRPARRRARTATITEAEFEVLTDIALGLTDLLIAERRHLSRRGVQSRLSSLYRKLGLDGDGASDGLNPRSRAVALALSRGLVNPHELDRAERDFAAWRAARPS